MTWAWSSSAARNPEWGRPVVRVYISIGSNHNRETNIAHALRRLRESFGEIQTSPVYRSAAVNGQGADYQNLAIGFDTALPFADVRQLMRSIEAELGRDRSQSEKISIDLDILLYGDETGPELPHPDVFRYSHVLRPMADIAGDLVPPGSTKTINQLLQGLAADTELERAGEYST